MSFKMAGILAFRNVAPEGPAGAARAADRGRGLGARRRAGRRDGRPELAPGADPRHRAGRTAHQGAGDRARGRALQVLDHAALDHPRPRHPPARSSTATPRRRRKWRRRWRRRTRRSTRSHRSDIALHRRWSRLVAGAVLAATAAACGRDRADCARCGTVVIAATGDPSHLLPPLAYETVARDIGDQVYERLADLAPGGAPIDSSAYRPALAARWERVDSLAWRFHLRPGARWQDGQPVTAEDVRFSFEAFADSASRRAGAALPHRRHRGAGGFGDVPRPVPAPSAEQLYDATFQVRVIPSHIWAGLPKAAGPPTPASRTSSGAARIAWRNGSAANSCAWWPTRPRRAADDPAGHLAVRRPIRTRRSIWC